MWLSWARREKDKRERCAKAELSVATGTSPDMVDSAQENYIIMLYGYWKFTERDELKLLLQFMSYDDAGDSDQFSALSKYPTPNTNNREESLGSSELYLVMLLTFKTCRGGMVQVVSLWKQTTSTVVPHRILCFAVTTISKGTSFLPQSPSPATAGNSPEKPMRSCTVFSFLWWFGT